MSKDLMVGSQNALLAGLLDKLDNINASVGEQREFGYLAPFVGVVQPISGAVADKTAEGGDLVISVDASTKFYARYMVGVLIDIVGAYSDENPFPRQVFYKNGFPLKDVLEKGGPACASSNGVTPDPRFLRGPNDKQKVDPRQYPRDYDIARRFKNSPEVRFSQIVPTTSETTCAECQMSWFKHSREGIDGPACQPVAKMVFFAFAFIDGAGNVITSYKNADGEDVAWEPQMVIMPAQRQALRIVYQRGKDDFAEKCGLNVIYDTMFGERVVDTYTFGNIFAAGVVGTALRQDNSGNYYLPCAVNVAAELTDKVGDTASFSDDEYQSTVSTVLGQIALASLAAKFSPKAPEVSRKAAMQAVRNVFVSEDDLAAFLEKYLEYWERENGVPKGRVRITTPVDFDAAAQSDGEELNASDVPDIPTPPANSPAGSEVVRPSIGLEDDDDFDDTGDDLEIIDDDDDEDENDFNFGSFPR